MCMFPLRGNQDPVPRLYYCFLTVPPSSLLLLPFLKSNCLNLAFGTSFPVFWPGKLHGLYSPVHFSRARLFATPWTAGCQGSLFITNFQSLLKLMSIESVMPSNLILCRPLFLPFCHPLQSFPASGSFPMSQFFASAGQSIGISDSFQWIFRTDFL